VHRSDALKASDRYKTFMEKANLRLDLTPMVDLGFLLISFFLFIRIEQQA